MISANDLDNDTVFVIPKNKKMVKIIILCVVWHRYRIQQKKNQKKIKKKSTITIS